MAERRALTGWGRTAPTIATVLSAHGADVGDLVRDAGERGVLVRGLGRSYGDAAQNAGGTVIELLDDEVVIDEEAQTCTASAGVSLDTLMRRLLPLGFFVPVTPGTRQVSVGGAIAADVHGKNHHVEGSFGSHVRGIDLVDGLGEARTLDPAETPEEFWATVGGMGLTGVITSATFALKPVETALMKVDTDRVPNLDALIAEMAATDDQHTYSVAWLDVLATGRSMGRAVLSRGEHAPYFELRDRLRDKARTFDPGVIPAAPPALPAGLINRLTVRAFNEAWYRKAPKSKRGELTTISAFFHPLDAVRDWNRVYGPRGLAQYQLAVPDGEEDTLREAVRRLSAAGAASFLSVLKRFGAANPGPLSFPIAGWTLAVDVPAAAASAPLMDGLDSLVAAAGGRVYLAKDSRATPETIAQMYPRLDEFRAARKRLDPNSVFVSDLSRRLEL